MRNIVTEVPSIKAPVAKSPGFGKKGLSSYKLDILGLCGFACTYCSSNCGYYLRINRDKFGSLAEQQTGQRMLPGTHPAATYVWPDILERLEKQLDRKRPGFGRGQTIVFSMLTDGFSPLQVQDGTTEKALRLLLDRTEFRIRVLTKNAIVGTRKWIKFFLAHPGRFVVGLSTGTMDGAWAQQVEVGTSSPNARLQALRNLQEAGVPTYGMLCPVFPDVLEGDGVERLLDAVRPEVVETIWAEPYNDRTNWQAVQSGYAPSTEGHAWLGQVYGGGQKHLWSKYATDLYRRLLAHAERHGWAGKLKYLLYERDIAAADAPSFAGLRGVLLQSKPGPDGRSQNPHIAELQATDGGVE